MSSHILDKINFPHDVKFLSPEELPQLCREIRAIIIDTMEKNGGHLASNLGVVEIITALHYVFDFPEDKIVFDVGHQCYTHKILTGRKKDFKTIRLQKGLSGFPRKKESPYDVVDSGHSATAISSAAGLAYADKIQGKKNHIIVLIGDGSLTGGEAFEGLNFSGETDLPLVIIVNDNGMSISKNIGSLAKYFGKPKISKFYQKLTDLYFFIIQRKKGPLKYFFQFAKWIEKKLKAVLGMENLFTKFGFEYIGPYDGHDVIQLVSYFQGIKKNVFRPIIVHLKTIKGKGYKKAEENPMIFHGTSPSSLKKKDKPTKTFTDVFSEKMVEMGSKYKDLTSITAAMELGVGLKPFHEKFPDRFFDAGIAEQHAVTFSSGLAIGGMKPVLAIYSTFLQRGFDQMFQDICISKIPVILVIDRAGIVGEDGETHHGQFDISYLRILPNMTILSPSCTKELEMMLEYAYRQTEPVAIRYPKETAVPSALDNIHLDLISHPFVSLAEGKDILIIAIGHFVSLAKEVVQDLKNKNKKTGLIYLRFLKPLPEEKLIEEIKKYHAVMVIEENIYNGSVSQEIASLILKYCPDVLFESINLPDQFIEHGTRCDILYKLGFTKENIEKRCERLLKNKNE